MNKEEQQVKNGKSQFLPCTSHEEFDEYSAQQGSLGMIPNWSCDEQLSIA